MNSHFDKLFIQQDSAWQMFCYEHTSIGAKLWAGPFATIVGVPLGFLTVTGFMAMDTWEKIAVPQRGDWFRSLLGWSAIITMTLCVYLFGNS